MINEIILQGIVQKTYFLKNNVSKIDLLHERKTKDKTFKNEVCCISFEQVSPFCNLKTGDNVTVFGEFSVNKYKKEDTGTWIITPQIVVKRVKQQEAGIIDDGVPF